MTVQQTSEKTLESGLFSQDTLEDRLHCDGAVYGGRYCWSRTLVINDPAIIDGITFVLSDKFEGDLFMSLKAKLIIKNSVFDVEKNPLLGATLRHSAWESYPWGQRGHKPTTLRGWIKSITGSPFGFQE